MACSSFDPQLPFPVEDYVLGLADVPGELNRWVYNALASGDTAAPSLARDFLYRLSAGMPCAMRVCVCTHKMMKVG